MSGEVKKAEIIAVGTELLMGQIVNTNAQYLSLKLAEIGVDVLYHTVVGDNAARLKAVLEQASRRADLIVLTGGLGPTEDDLTRDLTAEFLERSLEMEEHAFNQISRFFSKRNIVMTENNRKQALYISGATPLPNAVGMAVGSAIRQDGTAYLLLPGPPRELKPMYETYAKPWIEKHLDQRSTLYSKMLKFAGIGESKLAAELDDLIQEQSDPTLAPYAKEGEVTLRISTKATQEEAAFAKMEPVIEEIRRRIGTYLYAETEQSLEQYLIARFQATGQTLAVAESCTGGLLSERLTSSPGSSSVFLGGMVSYTNQAKQQQLGVQEELLSGPHAVGAISREAASQMATGAADAFHADYAISVTGVAGPEESEGKPVGQVYIGVVKRGEEPKVFEELIHGNRDLIRLRAVKKALFHLWKSVQEHGD
ncbi:competence/damage-inducible protein A [Marinicrinis sediminis]|uniref:Putative competence-damage inducible protein n=1 Tax=Marinicrinis sediminis TaxID=1652465 RepID=A0ABW5R4W4_9BACL